MANRPTPAQFVSAWQTGAQGATKKYTDGVATSKDWAANTIAALPQMIAGLQAAMADGRIQRGISNLGTTQWRAITTAKAGNWITGINSPVGVANMQAGVTKLYAMLDTAENAIATLPRGDINQNIARMTAFVTSMHQSKLNA